MPALDTGIIHRQLVEHMNEAVWMGDANEITVYANPKFCQLLGYTLEEMLGRPSYDFWDPESAERVRHVNMTDRKQGISSSYEGNLLTKDRRKIPVLLSGTPLPDGGTIGIMTDLRELRSKESVYRKLVEHMNEAVWMGDADERTVYANPKFCQLLGYTLEEMLGRPSYDFWDPESAERVKRANAADRRKGVSSSYEGNLLTKDGRTIPVLLSGTPLPDGGTIGIMTDLTQLKESEESERILGHAIQYANDAIIILNPQGVIQSWNKGAKNIFGYRDEEVLGQSIDLLFGAEVAHDMLAHAQMRFTDQIEGRHKKGQPVRIAATLTKVPADEDKRAATSSLLIARDVTAQMKFEEELSIRYQKLRDAYNRFGITRRQMDYLFDLIEVSTGPATPKQIADFVVNSVIMLTRVDACVLRQFNPQKKMLDLLSCFGVTDDWKGKASIRYAGSLAEKAFQTRLPLKIIDLAQEHRYTSVHLAKKHNLSSLLLIPLIFRDRLVGSLSLYVSPEKKLELFENDFIEQYAQLGALALAANAPNPTPTREPNSASR